MSSMPVCRVASKSRDLQSEHDTSLAHSDFGDQALKAFSIHS